MTLVACPVIDSLLHDCKCIDVAPFLVYAPAILENNTSNETPFILGEAAKLQLQTSHIVFLTLPDVEVSRFR